ncbi:hypothetical protein [Petroclostridium sp. X23]|uniref:hypothetical protein n=1 Tax=Petroclostridium sp. X23 TaxID=3045146 RepID=UPI0024AD294E|nr:hypothetical protein [Petroclostridium sp. X23]WHH59932.1 hypothetical protein QKW49_04055 [Petroclostridium sp. X23]
MTINTSAMKKQMIVQIFIFIFILMAFSVSAYAESNVEIISIQGGFDGTYKVGGWTPVTITVKNPGEDFEGEIQIIADSQMYEFKSAYSQPLNLAKNAEKQVTIHVPVSKTRASIDVQILQNNKVLIEQKYYFKKALNPNTLMIGALADNISGLRYLSGADFGNKNFSVQGELTQLSDKTFPANNKVLENFNVILINDFDVSTLNEEKKQNLIKWVEDGGLLVLASGPNYKKVYNGLPDHLKIAEVKGEGTLMSLDALQEYTGKNTTAVPASMQVSLLNTVKDNELVIQDGVPLIVQQKFGNGFIYCFAFDPGLEPFSTWQGANLAVWQNMVNSTVIGSVTGESWNSKMQYEFYHAMNNALRYIPSIKMPSFVLLLSIIGAFILVVGPINYFVLKKKDKREWAWVTIPAIVVIFSLGIYIIGFGTRFSSAVCSIVSIVEFKNDSKSVDVAAHTGLFNPKRGTLKISTSKDVEVDFTANPYIDRGYVGPAEEQQKKIISKFTLGDQPTVEFYDKGIWDFSSFIMNKKVSFPDGINNRVVISNNAVKGSIQNNTGFKIQDAFIVIGSSFAKIGDIDIAETKELDHPLEYINSARNDNYQLLNGIFGNNTRNSAFKIDDEWRVNQQRRSVFEYYNMMSNRRTGDNTKPVIYGWSDVDLQFEVYANEKPAQKYYQNLIVMPLELNFNAGETIQLPYGFINSKVDSTEGNVRVNPDPYNRGGIEIENSGKAVFKFSIPSQIEVESFTIDWFAQYMKFQPNNTLGILNHQTGNWDEITSYYHVDKDIVSQYISEDNEIKIVFDVSSQGDANNPAIKRGYSGMIPMPDIELEGVVR